MPIDVEDDPLDRRFPDEARIAPVSRLASRFLDAIEGRQTAYPGFARRLSRAGAARRRAALARLGPLARHRAGEPSMDA